MNTALGALQRQPLVDKINEAAEEIWESSDLPGSLRELTLSVNNDSIIALPYFVGELRAVKPCNKEWNQTELQSQAPRYYRNPWPALWNNWRTLGYSATTADIQNGGPLVLTINTADPTLIITIVGQTSNAAQIAEQVTMTATTKQTTHSFSNVVGIIANKNPSSNVDIADTDGNAISILHTVTQEARFCLYDISLYPSLTERVVDCLYKLRLQKMVLDSDCFPIPDYDDIILLKVKQLLAEDEPGKEQQALLMHQKIGDRLAKKAEHKTSGVKYKMAFAPRKMLGLFRPGRYYPGRRFSEW